MLCRFYWICFGFALVLTLLIVLTHEKCLEIPTLGFETRFEQSSYSPAEVSQWIEDNKRIIRLKASTDVFEY